MGILQCVASAILLVFVAQISRRMPAHTNSDRMKYSLKGFTAMAMTYFVSVVLSLVLQLSIAFSFDDENSCMTFLDGHKVGYFFVTVLSFLFGSVIPYLVLILYVHSITSPIAPQRQRRVPAPLAVNDTTPLLSGAALLDPISQMLLSARQNSLPSSGEPTISFDVNTYSEDSSSSSSTTSSQSSYSFLQPGDFNSAASTKPGHSDSESSESSLSHGFFDTDSDSESSFLHSIPFHSQYHS